MNQYEEKALQELEAWQKKMTRRPSLAGRMAKGVQEKVNSVIPEKVHIVLTAAIKNMVKAVLVGSEYTTGTPLAGVTLEERENRVRAKIGFYKKAAAASGAGTGAGGVLLSLADFPILLGIKMKFLFETATLYGIDVRDFRERLFILYLFQLAFSSPVKRLEIYRLVAEWDERKDQMPAGMEAFDWRSFQQEYRDYIDLAKMVQMLPGIGAVAGAVANYRLMDRLGETAMNGYRMRLLGHKEKA